MQIVETWELDIIYMLSFYTWLNAYFIYPMIYQILISNIIPKEI